MKLSLKMGLKGVTSLVVAFMLSACVTAPPVVQAPVVLERQGRFALKVQSPYEQPKAVQGNFRWQQSQVGWVMSLSGPMGATLARLSVDASGALLQSPDAPDQRASSATALLQKVLGEPVPVDALQDWIRGRMGDGQGITAVTRDESRRVTSFKQRGWTVTFARYDDVGPTRMVLANPLRGRDVTLRLVVDSSIR